MTFLRWKIINGIKYAYLVTGIRCSDNKIRSCCKYLGKEGSFDAEKLKIILRKHTEQKRKKAVLQRKIMKEREETKNRDAQKLIEYQNNKKLEIENKDESERIKRLIYEELDIIVGF